MEENHPEGGQQHKIKKTPETIDIVERPNGLHEYRDQAGNILYTFDSKTQATVHYEKPPKQEPVRKEISGTQKTEGIVKIGDVVNYRGSRCKVVELPTEQNGHKYRLEGDGVAFTPTEEKLQKWIEKENKENTEDIPKTEPVKNPQTQEPTIVPESKTAETISLENKARQVFSDKLNLAKAAELALKKNDIASAQTLLQESLAPIEEDIRQFIVQENTANVPSDIQDIRLRFSSLTHKLEWEIKDAREQEKLENKKTPDYIFAEKLEEIIQVLEQFQDEDQKTLKDATKINSLRLEISKRENELAELDKKGGLAQNTLDLYERVLEAIDFMREPLPEPIPEPGPTSAESAPTSSTPEISETENNLDIDPDEWKTLSFTEKETGTISDEKGTRFYKKGHLYRRIFPDGSDAYYEEERSNINTPEQKAAVQRCLDAYREVDAWIDARKDRDDLRPFLMYLDPPNGNPDIENIKARIREAVFNGILNSIEANKLLRILGEPPVAESAPTTPTVNTEEKEEWTEADERRLAGLMALRNTLLRAIEDEEKLRTRIVDTGELRDRIKILLEKNTKEPNLKVRDIKIENGNSPLGGQIDLKVGITINDKPANNIEFYIDNFHDTLSWNGNYLHVVGEVLNKLKEDIIKEEGKEIEKIVVKDGELRFIFK